MKVIGSGLALTGRTLPSLPRTLVEVEQEAINRAAATEQWLATQPKCRQRPSSTTTEPYSVALEITHAFRLRQKLNRAGDRFVVNVWGEIRAIARTDSGAHLLPCS